MATNKGINNAQNHIAFDQNSNAVASHEPDAVFGTGAVDGPQFNPSNNNLWFGSGNPNTNFNLADDGGVQLGLKIVNRQGADYLPTGQASNGEQDYTVLAGTQPGNSDRAEWNWTYSGTTADGVSGNNSAGLEITPKLNADDFKMQITETRPGFIASDVFDLNTSNHVWTGEASGIQFGGDDFNSPASPDTMQRVFQNSENVFFLSDPSSFFGSKADMVSAGTQWDFKTAAFAGGSPQMLVEDHVHLTLVSPS